MGASTLYIACIFARGGSKGVPNKNIRLINGKPLIGYAIEHAFKVPRIQKILVSTDSDEIAEIASEYGAEVPFLRPKELSSDEAPEWLAWQHMANYIQSVDGKKFTAMVSLPSTSPLRSPLDIERCLNRYEEGGADCVITVTESRHSPYFNMVTLDSAGLVNPMLIKNFSITRRQDVPKSYDVCTVAYVCNLEFVIRSESIFKGNVSSVLIPEERALDIDTEFDLEVARRLMDTK